MTVDYQRLRVVLERELEAGAQDALVQGGLDEMLRLHARDERPGSALLRMVANLPPEGYRSLDAEARGAWLRRALATIRRETDLVPDPVRPAHDRPPPLGEKGTQKEKRSRASARTGAAQGGAEQVPSRAKPRTAKAPRPSASDSLSPPAGERGPGSEARTKVAPGPAALDLPIERAGTGLRGATLARLQRLGIATVGDALRHYPHRHHDFTHTVPISALRVGQEQTVRGTVDRSREVHMGRGGRMRAAEVQVTDDLGSRIRAVWFNQPFIARSLPVGAEVALAGRVGTWQNRPTFQNPEYERLDQPAEGGAHTGRLVPVYPLTEGLPQRTLRGVIAKLLERYAGRIEDPLPEAIRKRLGLLGLVEATRQVHYPDSDASLREARRRLAFDELLAVQIGVVTRKREWKQAGDALAIANHAAAEAFLASLPFTLTAAQQRVLAEVRADLASTRPMSRLLEGDVGSGKTVVALAAMLATVAAGGQAVLMAPTEVLAEQHFRTLCRLLSGEPEPPLHGLVRVPGFDDALRIVLLTGSTRAAERRDAVEAIRHGGAHLIVGTHALIQEGVDYHRLGFAVVDEQHRFGVVQRGDLRRKGAESTARVGATMTPHLLAMSATPIPRSLALTLYGDLDLSVIDEMPPGRTPIATRYLTPIQRAEAFAHVRREVAAGRQAFVICPLVEGSAAVESRAATEEFERLRTEEFPDLAERIVLLHGRMASRDKDRVMRAFADGDAAILVSTAVVEVGIDVPNATVMLIEGADRFGLAQLHQFRGRVGRGDHPATCYLLADDPSAEAEERLSLMERTTNGFELAEADLQLRGPGDIFGTAQSGMPTLRVASLLDAPLIDTARREAETLLAADPDLRAPEHRALRYAVAERASEVTGEMH